MGAYAIAPTRVHEKPVRFHISAHGYTKNAPDFIFPNKDKPKTCPILAANPWRRTFWGVCNTPLHGYMKNPPGFIFPHTDTPKTHPISPPDKDTPKTRPVLGLNLWRGTFSERMQYAPTRVRAKFVQFHISAHEYNKNTPYFTFPHTDTPKTYPISPSQIRIHPKPARF